MKYINNINYDNVDECLEYLRNNPYQSYCFDEEIPFHVFWRGKLKRKQLLCINSYLYSQNLGNTKLYVWLDSDYKENSKLIKKHPNIIIKNYDPKKESLNTPFKYLINDFKLLSIISGLLIEGNAFEGIE